MGKKKDIPNSKKKSQKAKGRLLKTSENFPIPVLLSNIDRCFSEELKKHGDSSVLSIADNIIKDLTALKLPKTTLKICKNKVISILKTKLISMVNIHYENLLEKDDASELEVLAAINNPSYTSGIIEDPLYSDDIKKTVQASIPIFVEKKLEELDITREEFDLFIEDPSAQKAIRNIQDSNYVVKPVDSSIDDDYTPQDSVDPLEEAETSILDNVSEPEVSETELEKGISFFDQVKLYTNNFRFLVQPEYMKLSTPHIGKFKNYESYLKFQTFQDKLYNYMMQSHKSEIDVLNQLISQKSNQLTNLDLDFVRILEERKKVIDKQISRD